MEVGCIYRSEAAGGVGYCGYSVDFTYSRALGLLTRLIDIDKRKMVDMK